MDVREIEARLTTWVAEQLQGADQVRIEGLDRVAFGHSAETLLFTVAWRESSGEHREDVVLRVRPPAPGLLEPYDLRRQFEILHALSGSAVRAPRALWYEGSGAVLGREFYVMQRLPGEVYERGVPAEIAGDPARVRRMGESLVEQLAAIHTVDLRATGLDRVADGHGYLDRELAHWGEQVAAVQRGPLPAIERLLAELKAGQPAQCPRITLVHGDAKPGNYAFTGAEVSAVFDWEMATIGDPLADLGWLEILWPMPGSVTSLPGALTAEEMIGHWEARTGITAQHRAWYRAFQGLKLAVIMLVGGMRFDAGHSDDLRLAEMAGATHFMTQVALQQLGIDEELPSGPVRPRPERVAEVRSRRA